VKRLLVWSAPRFAWVISTAACAGWLTLAIDNGYAPAIFICCVALGGLVLVSLVAWSKQRARSRRTKVWGTSQLNGSSTIVVKDQPRPR
jgi:hypothetical protein